MSSRTRWTALGLVVAAGACNDIAPPIRSGFYEWRRIEPAQGGGEDSLSFHWPKNRLPVRVWVEDNASLPENVPQAIAAWRTAFLYGEFDARVVSDSSAADVIVRAAPAPATPEFSRVRLPSALAPQCTGATDINVTDDHTRLLLPVRIYVDPHSDPNAPNLAECLALTTTHEMGHALGIWRHSDDPADLMFMDPQVPGPDERDLATAEVLYHLPANVQPVGP